MDSDTALATAVEHHRAGRLDHAAMLYRAIVAAEPDNAAAWINLGAALRGLGQTGDALDALGHAVALVPDHAGARLNLGNALVDHDQPAAAAEAFAAAAALEPGMIDAYVNWGDALCRAGQTQTAIEVFERGLAQAPDHPGLRVNLGNAFLSLHDPAAALPYLRAAIAAEPANAMARRNLANALRLNGDLDAALNILNDVIDATANDADARCLRAFCAFAAGDWPQGWADYAHRWHSGSHEAARPFTQPAWTGQDLSGKTLLVWGEQAVGDELMFATMLNELSDLAGRLIVETEHRLCPLFARAFAKATVIARTEPPDARLAQSAIDYQIAIGDLGRMLRPDANAFAANRSYLVADRKRAEDIRRRYDALAGSKPRIGISWRSGTEHAGAARGLDQDALAALFRGLEGWTVSLQYGDVSGDIDALNAAGVVPPFVDTAIDPLKSLEDQAAQIAALDAVVSVANTTVHLAGALGVPTIALLAHVPDWRWQLAGEGSCWYPSVHLVRQTEPGNWNEVLARTQTLTREMTRNAAQGRQ